MSAPPLVKFLLVDDREENLLALEGLLRRDGLDLLMARSGREALELLLDQDVGLAILDVQMPEMDGFELAELMRGSLRTKHVPIIFLTAAGHDDGRSFRGYEAGAVDFLFKPIQPAILKGKADVFYDLARQRQEIIRQREELRAAAEENARLYNEILSLNGSLEERVRKRTDQLLETNEQLQGFTYSIAHDFRQHIRGINVNSQIILSEATGEFDSCRPNIERIHQLAMLMNQMTDDLLTYARMRTISIRPVEIDLSDLAREIVQGLKPAFPHTRFKVADGIRVCGDRTMFRIVLENLLDNGFKYSQNSSEPEVEVGRASDGFYVKDNGIGIDMAYADKLFLPFERLQPGNEFAGTGMGLANVKRILDRHGGCIEAASEPGVGTTFTVSLRHGGSPNAPSLVEEQ